MPRELHPDTPPEIIQRQILGLSHQIQERIDRMPDLRQDVIEAEKVCNIATGAAYLAASGTVGEREAHVKMACVDELARLHEAEMAREDNKKALDKLADAMSGLQSVLSGRREEMRLARIGDGP